MARMSGVWYRKSRGQWYTTLNGQQVPLGVADPRAVEAAVAALRALLAATSPPGAGGRPVPVAAAVAAFLRDRGPHLAPATREGYARYLGWLAARFGTVPVSALDPAAVEADAAARPTWGPDTRRNYLQAAEVMLKHFGRPVRLAKPPRGSAGAKAVVPEAAYHMALGAAGGDLRPLLEVLWNTGCRPAEAYTLTAADIDWPTGTARLGRHKTARQTGKPKLLVFGPAALAVLERQRAKYPEGLLFRHRRGGAWRPRTLAKAVWGLARRVGRPITAYGMRHTFATAALEKGVPEAHVAAALGHTSTVMLAKHYSHIGENAALLRDVMTRVRPPG